ncbi:MULTISPECIES: hypothetical protein [Priestia]|uniref:hypothetical protein n=1 Tax=Priestia TaxID=2800373 RepID=UPI002404F06E|nr:MULTISPECIES: hypothetical protein [Priestia]MDG0062000.1 hypothetical protein [Priestia sp. P5]WDC91277.1 hypothetical protein PSR56_27430 [Priestia megaterium]
MTNSITLGLYTQLQMKISMIMQLFIPKKKTTNALANPILWILVALAAAMVAWAVGESICWAHGKRHFSLAMKVSTGYFKIGCKK